MSITEESLEAIGKDFLASINNLSTADNIALRAPSCIHVFGPASLNIPQINNEGFEKHMNSMMLPLLSGFSVTIKELHVNVPKRQVTLWATGVPHFKPEAKGQDEEEKWKYQGEYIIILDVNEEGRIERVVEFLDSKEAERLRGLFKRAKENLGL